MNPSSLDRHYAAITKAAEAWAASLGFEPAWTRMPPGKEKADQAADWADEYLISWDGLPQEPPEWRNTYTRLREYLTRKMEFEPEGPSAP